MKILLNKDAESSDMATMMADYQRQVRDVQARIKADRIAGEAALRRLLPIAQRDTGQSERVARVLLGLYNGRRFPLDLTNLRSLDYEIVDDVLAVLRMDSCALQEVHCYFEHGGLVFEKLADDWGFETKGGA